ncbi:MAG TPA: type II toxin-antitoxin system death-on-curing family toxin [Candidatus Eisenbacteria bacterium]|nr:type II toxin-antitoxin system death-on-curing family toxin [Candidatus Eisenbacteria bacterium]
MKPRWVPKAAVLAIHEALLAEHGGSPGLLNESALESALANPQNRLAYSEGSVPDYFDLATQYASSLTRNHPFQDGNKRVAFTVAAAFLEMNGFRLDGLEADAVKMVEALSTREVNEAVFADWLRANSAPIPKPKKSPRSTPRLSAINPPRSRRKTKRR